MLREFVALYVPSRDRRGQLIPDDDRGACLDTVQRSIADRFGGFTQTDAIGGWNGESGIIIERVSIVKSWVATVGPDDVQFLETLAAFVAVELNQEAVSIETPAGLSFVSAPVVA